MTIPPTYWQRCALRDSVWNTPTLPHPDCRGDATTRATQSSLSPDSWVVPQLHHHPVAPFGLSDDGPVLIEAI